MADFLTGLTQGMQSPLFLGGVGLLSGGGFQGMNQGIQAGILGQRQAFDQQQALADRQRQAAMDAENMRRWNATDARAAEMHPGQLDIQKAQAQYYRGRANAQHALANVRDGRAAPEAPDPLKGWGQDENGNLVPPRGPAITNGPAGAARAPEELPDDIAPQMANGAGRFSPGSFGPVGRQADSIPGVVTDSKGKPSEFASRVAAGQGAMQAQPAGEQQRLRKYYENQQMWTQVHGKAPSGYAYNEKGGLEDLKNKTTATERSSRMHAESGMKTLDAAISILGKANTAQQLAGDTYQVPGTNMKVGGFGEAGRGFRSAESAVLQLNFALSGKSVSNAEREHFMRIYMPTAFDSSETQKFKLGKIKEFFQTVLDARKRGMDDDKLAELYRQKLAEGVAGHEPEQRTMKPGKYRYDPATGGMVPQ